MEIVPPVAGSQGFLPVGPPPSYVDIAAGVTQGLGTGSVRPLFGARRGSNPWLNPWLIGDARGWLARACAEGALGEEGPRTQSIAGQRGAYPRPPPAASSTGQRS